MKKFVVGLVFLALGCVQVNSYVKPDVDFSKIKKIAVVKFNSQVATDITILALIQRGFNVVEKEKLSESGKQSLQNEGIDAILYGSTEESRETFIREVAEVSVSLRMYDSINDKLIWSANSIKKDLSEINKNIRMMVDTIPKKEGIL